MKCGFVVRALALRFWDWEISGSRPIELDPGSPRFNFSAAFVNSQLGCLRLVGCITVVVVVAVVILFCCFIHQVVFDFPWKALMRSGQLSLSWAYWFVFLSWWDVEGSNCAGQSWSDIPGITETFSTPFGLFLMTRSKMFWFLVGSSTTWVKLLSSSISPNW